MYNRALVAIDRDEASAHQVLKAAQGKALELRVVHVLEPQEVQYSIDPTIFTGSITAALQQQALDAARQRIHSLCETSGVEYVSAEVLFGHTTSQIVQAVEDLQCDLIVMGSHGRRGWQLMLGSTANAVLHHAPVDVLAHRILPIASD